MTKATKRQKFLLKDVKSGIKTLVNNNNYNGYFFIDCNEHRLTIRVVGSNYRLKQINLFFEGNYSVAKTDIYITNLKNLPKIIKKINSFNS